jgi:predicted O-methyltransferase YrrM
VIKTLTESETVTDPSLLDRVRKARRSLDENRPTTVRSVGDFNRVSVPYADADVLRDWLLAERARIVIEIGLAYGVSALAIAEALVANGATDNAHVIIDPHQDQFDDVGWKALVAAGLSELCSLEQSRSQFALPRLATDGLVADAAFVDGSHIFHNVFVDLYYLRELVRPGGLVILDDCDWQAVATAARYFEANADWQLQRDDRRTRLRAYRLPSPRVEPTFEDFKPFGLDFTGTS